jgi:catechol-2,3-dioxygenase
MSKPQPRKLGHLVLKVRDIHKSCEFYTEVVGLTVSDWISDRMVFLRAGSDHHDLALAQLGEDALQRQPDNSPGLEHFSYLVDNYEEMERTVVLLKERNIPIVRGPGKHGPGENCFLVFKDPDGNNVEFYCEMLQVDAEHPHQPAVWKDTIDSLDQWHFKRWAVEPPPALKKKYNL